MPSVNRTTRVLLCGLALLALAPAGAAELAGARTTRAIGAEQRLDPYKNYRYLILMDGHVVAGVSKLSASDDTLESILQGKDISVRVSYDAFLAALKNAGSERINSKSSSDASTDVVKHRAGGDPGSAPKKLPGRTQWESITLERGVTHDSGFWNWLNAARAFGKAKSLTVILRDEAGNPVQRFTLRHAWVSESQALPDLDAGAHTIAIEHIKLQYESWERDPFLGDPSQE